MLAKEVLEKAERQGYAVGAFNAATFETLRAIIQAAQKLESPVIVESSPAETEYITPRVLAAMVKAFREKTGLSILLNLDHAHSFQAVETAANAGYQLLHFDGSIFNYETNVEMLTRVAEFAHKRGDLVEGEMDKIPGESIPHLKLDAGIEQKKNKFTKPEKAASFVQNTGVDILAVFFGNVHGVYRIPPKLDFKLLKKIRESVSCFLSLHGGSGIPPDDIKRTIQVGKIVKINVNTELRMAYRRTLEEALKQSDEVAIYKIMPPVIQAVQKVVEEKIKIFGSEGKA